jgi:hypothetical protein
MKKETVKQIILTADEGMYLTNGDTYGRTVVLPESADQNEWREITEEEYNELQAESEAGSDG